MIIDVYQTTACKGYRLDNIYESLKAELITFDNIVDLTVNDRLVNGVKLLVGEASHISSFSHPIIVSGSNESFIVVDVRRLVRSTNETLGNYKVQSPPDFDLLILRARIMLVALRGNMETLMDFDPLPATIFARWVNNALAFKMGLNMYEQNVIVVLGIIYYFKLFSSDVKAEDLILFINRNTYIDNENINDIIDVEDLDISLNSLSGFIEVLKLKVPNVRMEKLSIPLLLASLTYGWRGSDAKEVMAVCLEHPPTWIGCLTVAIKDKNFKHSPISKVVKNYTRKNKDKEFLIRLEEVLANNERY